MRILFASYAERTDTVFQACVPLAWALRAAGHDVLVAAQPALTPTVTKAGLSAVPVGRDHDLWRIQQRFVARLAARHPELHGERVRGGRMPPFDQADDPGPVDVDALVAGYRWAVSSWYRMVNQPMLAELVAFCRCWRPDLVLWEPGTYAAPIAAAACGATHGRLLWGLDVFGRTRRRYLAARTGDTPDPLRDWLGAQAAAHGVDWSEDLATGRFTVEQLPARMRMHTGLDVEPVRYTAYNGAAVVSPWLRTPPARPRVVVTLGLTMDDQFDGHAWPVPDLLAELGRRDVEVVATLSDRAAATLPPLPGRVRVVRFAPLHALVEGAAAVVHHGGFGTFGTTVLAGVPQLVVPEHFDEPPLARRLAATGAGLTEPAATASGSELAAGVDRLLDEPAFAGAARDLREELTALPSPATVAAVVAELVDRHRSADRAA